MNHLNHHSKVANCNPHTNSKGAWMNNSITKDGNSRKEVCSSSSVMTDSTGENALTFQSRTGAISGMFSNQHFWGECSGLEDNKAIRSANKKSRPPTSEFYCVVRKTQNKFHAYHWHTENAEYKAYSFFTQQLH